MKILYTVPYYPAHKHQGFIDEISVLLEKGYDVEIAPIWKSYIRQGNDDLKVPVIYNPNIFTFKKFVISLFIMVFNPNYTHKFILFSKKYLGYQESILTLSLLKNIEKSNPDHIHAFFANNAALKSLLIARFLKIRFSCSGRGTDVLIKRIPHFKFLVNNSRPFFTLSRYNKEQISKISGINKENIKVIHHGIRVDKVTPSPKVPLSRPLKIVSTTWLRKVKGVKYLVDACALLRKKNIDFQCYIIGDGALKKEINKQINEMQLQKQVILIGSLPHNDVLAFLKNCHIFVLPSLSEGIAIAAMEAMALGLPTIVTNITGMPELVENEVNGLLVPPENPIAIAEAVEKLYNDQELQKKITKNGIQTIHDKFNIRTNINEFLNEIG